ncbi:cation-transporting P-type ATPase [Streptomyces sp. NPDC003952]
MPAPAAGRAPATRLKPGGLTERKAGRLLVERGRNEIAAQPATPFYARVLAQLRDPLVMVLMGAVLLTIAIGYHADSVVIGLVTLFNTAVGVTQDLRRQRGGGPLCDVGPGSACTEGGRAA